MHETTSIADGESATVPAEMARMYRAEALQYTYGGRTGPAEELPEIPKGSMLRPFGLLVLATALAAGYAATLRTPRLASVSGHLVPRDGGVPAPRECGGWAVEATAPAELAAELTEGARAWILPGGRSGVRVEARVSRIMPPPSGAHAPASGGDPRPTVEALVRVELESLDGSRCDLGPGPVRIDLEVGDRPLLVPDPASPDPGGTV